MDRTIDHVPYACSDLDRVSDEFERLGLTPEYGGVHDNDCTHMSILGFDDDTYLELISEVEQGDHDFWPEHIRADAGPAAWCIRVPDIVTECRRVLEAGYPVNGPLYGSRKRTDGTLVEWDRAEFGSEKHRLLLPFAIADRTPLSYRISPSPSVSGGPITGLGEVVVAVRNLEATVQLFSDIYRCPQPVHETVADFGEVASIPGFPLAVTEADNEWLENRLTQFGECPCTVLLSTDDMDAVREEYPLREPLNWPNGRVAFFDSDVLGSTVGVVE